MEIFRRKGGEDERMRQPLRENKKMRKIKAEGKLEKEEKENGSASVCVFNKMTNVYFPESMNPRFLPLSTGKRNKT